MSQNILQIFTANPASSMVATDLLYLGRSPYGPTDDFAITFSNFVASIGTATPTASTIPRWDSHVNMSANNFLSSLSTTATAASTTTFTVSSAYNQYFTGSTTQTVLLPVTSTLSLGFPFRIINNSTGVVTVQSSGANTIQAMAPGSSLLLTCIITSGTSASSWDAQYQVSASKSAETFNGDSGTATPSAGVINFTGASTGLTFAGTSSTMTLGGTLAISNGGTGVTSATTAITASNFAAWNASGFLLANSFVASLTSVTTAGGTTVIGAGGNYFYNFTGSSNQAVTLPAAVNVVAGRSFYMMNISTGTITVSTPTPAVVVTMAPSTTAILVCTNTSGVGAAAWNVFYSPMDSLITLDGDSGNATPALGVITISGASTGLTFTGSGSTLTLGGVLSLSNGGLGTAFNSPPSGSALFAWTGSHTYLTQTTPNGLIFSSGGLYANTIVSSGGTTLEPALAYNYYILTGTQNQTFKYTYPITTPPVIQVGTVHTFRNLSTGVFTVQDPSFATLLQLASGQTGYVQCVDNTTSNGTWTSSVALSNASAAGQLLSSDVNSSPLWLTTPNNATLISSSSGVAEWLANSVTPGYVLTANSGAPPSWQADGYLSGSVLLSPSGDQTIINAHNLIMGTGSMVAPTILPGNLSLSGNTISSMNTNGNILLNPNGTGSVVTGSTIPIATSSNSLQIIGINGSSGNLLLAEYSSSTNVASAFDFFRSRSTIQGTFVAVQNNDVLGYTQWIGDDGTSFGPQSSASITCRVQGTVSTGIVPTTLIFGVTNAAGSNIYPCQINATGDMVLTQSLLPASGGTGTATAPSAGQIPIGVTGGTYTPAAINSGTGIVVANGSGSITVSATGGGFATATISGTTQTAVVSTKYIALNATQTTLTLPAVYAVGDVVSLIGSTANTGGWIVQAATGDTIRINNATTSSGGTVTSTAAAGQCIDLVCDVANSSWIMTGTSSILLTTA